MKTKLNKIISETTLSFLLLMLISINIHAVNRDPTSGKFIHMIGIDLKPGYTFPTHEFF